MRRPRVHVYTGFPVRLDTSDRPLDDLRTALARAWAGAVRTLDGGPGADGTPEGDRTPDGEDTPGGDGQLPARWH
ncbi:hypothetical protein [Streptomyces sp. AGS-58]|uniref:hypothetical protein n=1 Tax=unclassified Streptomyces TaxID=2593676 RepID=UPI0035A2F621